MMVTKMMLMMSKMTMVMTTMMRMTMVYLWSELQTEFGTDMEMQTAANTPRHLSKHEISKPA